MATFTQLNRGMLLHDVPARTLDGRQVYASDFRGRRNLIVIFSGAAAEQSSLLNELVQTSAELQEEETVVLMAGADDDLRRLFGAITPEGRRIAALYVTDRYGEIYFAAHRERRPLPGASEILEWLTFINAQCPE